MYAYIYIRVSTIIFHLENMQLDLKTLASS